MELIRPGRSLGRYSTILALTWHIQHGHMIPLYAFYDLLINNHFHTGFGRCLMTLSTVLTLQECHFRFFSLRHLLPGPLNRPVAFGGLSYPG